MADALTEQDLIKKCSDYLRATYSEELVDYDILDNEASDGTGELTMEGAVRAGGGLSRWQKTFTFRDGRIANMNWRHLG